MIAATAACAKALAGSHVQHLRVSSYLSGQLLADNIPVASGEYVWDGSLAVPERVTLSVPAWDNGYSWYPGVQINHPLAPWGQRLVVEIGIGVGRSIEWLKLPPTLIYSTELSDDGDTVNVETQGLLTLLDEAKLISPVTAMSGNWYRKVVTDLVAGAFPLDIQCVDRMIPVSRTWDTERLGALADLIASWPANMRIDTDEQLVIYPGGDPTTAVISLTNGRSGTLIGAAGKVSREGAVNMAYASGDYNTTGLVKDMAASSATRFGGPFNPLPVPDLYSDTMLFTTDQCRAAASKRLADRRREGPTRAASIVPDPRIEGNDAVYVTDSQWTNQLCVVDQLRLPLTPEGGAETLSFRAIV